MSINSSVVIGNEKVLSRSDCSLALRRDTPRGRVTAADLRDESTASPPVNPFGVGRWRALDWRLAGAGGGVGRRGSLRLIRRRWLRASASR